jgi:Kef-type K+ transport system membrane component KefB
VAAVVRDRRGGRLRAAGRRSRAEFGQLVVAAGTIADFGAIILLSVLFTGEGSTASTLLLIGALLGMAVALCLVVTGAERSRLVMANLKRRGARRTAAAALFQAASLPFVVAATAIGAQLHLIGGRRVRRARRGRAAVAARLPARGPDDPARRRLSAR